MPTGLVECQKTSGCALGSAWKGGMEKTLKLSLGVVSLCAAVVACEIAKSPTEPTDCSVAISPASLTFNEQGGAGTVVVTTPSGCSWSATASSDWVVITAGRTGAGPGTVAYSVAANPAADPRSGTLTIEDQRHTIAQTGRSPIACSYAIAPANLTFGEDGGTGTVTVTTAPGCAWTAAASADWVAITAGGSGDGPGTVTYAVTANPAAVPRTGILTIEDQRHTIAQAGRPPVSCRYDLEPENAEVGPDAAEGTFAVRTSSGCVWSATSTASWLVVGAGE
jgi:hypothetical protein